MKKLISGLLVVAILSAMFISCSEVDSGKNNMNDSTTSNSNDIIEVDTAETTLSHNLPEVNYEEATFTMLVRSTRVTDFNSEEYTGEVLNDAVYDRNALVSTEFGVEFSFVEHEDNSSSFNNVISQSVLSGDGAYDIIAPDYWWRSEVNGWFLNLNNLPYLDFTQPWWCVGWNEGMEIADVLIGAVGWYTLDMISNMIAVFFNKPLYESYGHEDLYDLVRSKNWTFDTMNQYGIAATSDLNGDGVYDLNDQLGTLSALHAGRGLLWSSGLTLSERAVDGSLVPTLTTEKNYEIFQKVLSFYESDSNYYSTSAALPQAFASNKSLFVLAAIRGTGNALRDMDSDFGIVPYPLFNENQKEYISFNLGTSYFAIPITANDSEMSSIILEALNYYSYLSVRPIFYDTVLKAKVSRDTDTHEMLDLVIETCKVDPFFIFGSNLSGVADKPFSLIEQKKDTYMSEMATIESQIDTLLEELITSITSAE